MINVGKRGGEQKILRERLNVLAVVQLHSFHRDKRGVGFLLPTEKLILCIVGSLTLGNSD